MADLNIEAERALFEAWHNRQYIGTEALEWAGSGYDDFDHNRAWKAWQAARSAVPAQAGAADESELQFNATRLRSVARLVGLESAMPQDDATLDGARGSVLGMIAGALRNRAAAHSQAQGEHSAGVALSPEQIAVLHRACNTLALNGKAEAANLIRGLAGITVDTPIATAQGDGEHSGRVRYTCIGKGGEYELLGVVYGAGTSRGSTVNLYREIGTGVMYYRTPADFAERMQPVAAAHKAQQERGNA